MPATGNFILDKGYDAEAAITKFRAVKLGTAAESVTPITAQGEDGVGVAQFGVTTAEIAKGKGASVRHQGITEWETNAAVTKGVDVTVAADGRCEPAATGDRVWGKALQAASGAGLRISVELAAGVHYIKA